MHVLVENPTGKGIRDTIPIPRNSFGEALVFNTLVEGSDVFGEPVSGVVRGYGPPLGYYDGVRLYEPNGSRGPDSAFVVVQTSNGYVECYAEHLRYCASFGPSPHEVGLERDDCTGHVWPIGERPV